MSKYTNDIKIYKNIYKFAKLFDSLSDEPFLRLGQRAAESLLVTGVAPRLQRQGLHLVLQVADRLQGGDHHRVRVEQVGVAHAVLDVHQLRLDVHDQRLEVRAELTDVLILLRFAVQNGGL